MGACGRKDDVRVYRWPVDTEFPTTTTVKSFPYNSNGLSGPGLRLLLISEFKIHVFVEIYVRVIMTDRVNMTLLPTYKNRE